MGESASWRPVGTPGGAVELRCGPLCGVLQPTDASVGLTGLSLGGVSLASSAALFAVTTPAGPLTTANEVYVRGSDHVSTHPPHDGFPFRTQLYWSAKSVAGGGVAATLAVSLQTDLLDTRPELTLAVSLGVEGSATGNACRFDLPSSAVIVLPYPSDWEECVVTTGTQGCHLQLAPPFLEKGVIRRLRTAAIVLPPDADDTAASAAIADLADDPLPLTT